MEEALEASTVKYLALKAFRVVRADCFWEGFEEFRDVVADLYPDLDFSSIKPNEGGAEDEDEEQVEADQEDIVIIKGAVKGERGITTEGVVKVIVVAKPGEISREEVTPGEGEVAMGDRNPQE